MHLPEPAEALAAARAVLQASVADETEVTLEHLGERFVRFAPQGPTQCGDRERVQVSIRVRMKDGGGGYREARASSSSLSRESVDRALERAMSLAGAATPDEFAVPLGGPVELPPPNGEGDRLAANLDHGFASKADWIRQASSACRDRDLVPSGLVQTGGRSVVLINSEGREAVGHESRARFELTAFDASGKGDAGMAEASCADARELDPGECIARAVSKASAARAPAPIAAGEYAVVLESPAVASMMLFPCYFGFGAQEVNERSSFLCSRVGEQQFPVGLELVDDPFEVSRPSLAFDDEGTPRCRTPLLAARALTGPVTDSRWARRLGVPNTGHAMPQPTTQGPKVRHLVLRSGSCSIEELAAQVGSGLLVSKLHYTNLIEPRSLTLTGMTRGGVFRIEGGEVREAVQNLRFTESLVQALMRVGGIGNRPESSGALFDGEVVAPALAIDGFRFTSTTDF